MRLPDVGLTVMAFTAATSDVELCESTCSTVLVGANETTPAWSRLSCSREMKLVAARCASANGVPFIEPDLSITSITSTAVEQGFSIAQYTAASKRVHPLLLINVALLVPRKKPTR